MFRAKLLLREPFSKYFVTALAICLSICFTFYYVLNGLNLVYGDSESHLNISKRVVSSVTPGLAQLGGVWLPLTHIFMMPFVYFDFLWRTGLAGSIVSGMCYVATVVFIYLLLKKITQKELYAILGAAFFAINPNILFMQTTAMTELPLIALFVISQYFFYLYLTDDSDIPNLIYGGIFCFAATLTRYDGWFLAITQLAAIFLHFLWVYIHAPSREIRQKTEATILAFASLACFGILLWLLWCYLILGDPLYFTHSIYSAASQQNGWKARGELPAYHNLWLAIVYYADTAAANTGLLFSFTAVIGLVFMIFDRKVLERANLLLVLFTPFIFNVITLYMGQSVIFIPNLTPAHFEYHLFNVRYGILMIPTVSILCAYLLSRIRFRMVKVIFAVLLAAQMYMFVTGAEAVISLEDGMHGLSGMQRPDAELWLKKNYDHGFIVMDDFARTVSIIKADIPMQYEIYVGNKPYYENALTEPEKNVRWIVMQKDDEIWKRLYDDSAMLNHVYKYFERAYTSPNILIFKRNSVPAES